MCLVSLYLYNDDGFDDSLNYFLKNSCDITSYQLIKSRADGIVDAEKEWEITFAEQEFSKVRNCVINNLLLSDQYDFDFYKNKIQLNFDGAIEKDEYQLFVMDLAVKGNSICESGACDLIVLLPQKNDVSFWGIYKN